MKKNSTLILLGLFAVLAGYVYLFKPQPRSEEEALIKVFPADIALLQKIEVQTGREKIIAERRDRNWAILSPDRSDPESAQKLRGFLEDLRQVVKIDQVGSIAQERLHEFGLDPPRQTIRLFFPSSPKPVVLILGANNPAQTRVYAKFDGSDKVFLVGSLIDFEIQQLFRHFTSSTQSRRSLP